jgi:hypothetical protein
MLNVIEKLLQLVTEDSNTQLLIKAYISLIGACGIAQVIEGRDALLTSLCRECVSIQKETQSKDKPQTPQT